MVGVRLSHGHVAIECSLTRHRFLKHFWRQIHLRINLQSHYIRVELPRQSDRINFILKNNRPRRARKSVILHCIQPYHPDPLAKHPRSHNRAQRQNLFVFAKHKHRWRVANQCEVQQNPAP